MFIIAHNPKQKIMITKVFETSSDKLSLALTYKEILEKQ